MYNLTLTTSYFPLQRDAELREITVGWLLRGIAASHGPAVAGDYVPSQPIWELARSPLETY